MADLNVTDELTDERVATCLDEMLPAVYNQVALSNPLLNQLELTDWKEERNGGARIRVPLRVGKNTSFKTFTKGSIMTPAPYPIMAWCYWNMKQGAGDFIVDWVTEREQAGSGNVIDLVQQRVEALADGIREEMNTMLWASIVGNSGMDLNGLRLLIPPDPRTGVMAGFDRALHQWWRNCYWDNNASGNQYRPHPSDADLGAPANVGAFGSIANGYSTVLNRMGTMLNNAAWAESRSDYFIITDQLTYEQYVASAQFMDNFNIALSNDESVVRYNFGDAMFRGINVFYDSIDAPAGYMWFICKRYFKLISDSAAWFTWTAERSPYNQFAKVRYLMLRGQVVNFLPSRHAVLQGITAWA